MRIVAHKGRRRFRMGSCGAFATVGTPPVEVFRFLVHIFPKIVYRGALSSSARSGRIGLTRISLQIP